MTLTEKTGNVFFIVRDAMSFTAIKLALVYTSFGV